MIYDNFAPLSDLFDTLLVDAYGVFWGGQSPIPNSLETLAAQVQQGKQVCILSNTTLMGQANIDLYTRRGLIRGIHYTDVVTSGDVFYHALKTNTLPWPGTRIYPFGRMRWRFDADMPYRLAPAPDQADMILFGVPQLSKNDLAAHPEFRSICYPTHNNPDWYDTTCIDPFLPAMRTLVSHHLPAVSTNPDLVALEGSNWIIRQGTFAQTYRDLGGQVAEYGKPYGNIYEYTFQKLGIKPSPRVAMIGDTFRTDIRGALDNGLTPVWCLDYGVAAYEQSRGLSLEAQAGGSLDGIYLIRHL